MLEFLLWFIGVPLALVATVLIVWGAEWAVGQVGDAAARCQSRFSCWRNDADRRAALGQDRESFLQWLAEKSGSGELGGQIDGRLVEAQQQADTIRFLIEEEIPKAVMRCLETHRLMASVTGALHMFETAYETECYSSRANVVWLLGHTVRFLESYPLKLDDPRLTHNTILLRKRALPICRRCPYIQGPTSEAPRLCPTAELVQLGGQREPKA